MGILYGLIGASGAGKTSIGRSVFGADSELTSTTTRPMRAKEIEGKDYYFIKRDDFLRRLNNGEFAEDDYYDNNYYGLELKEIQSKTQNKDAFVVITKHGFDQVKEKYPNVISVFVDTNLEDIQRMLKDRGDSQDLINRRIELYNNSKQNKNKCNFIIPNVYGEMDMAIKQLQSIVEQNKQII